MTEEYVPREKTNKQTKNLRKITKWHGGSNIPKKEFKVNRVKMLIKLERRVEELWRHSVKRENIEKNESDLKNTITVIKLHWWKLTVEYQMQKKLISDLEDKIIESTPAKSKKK